MCKDLLATYQALVKQVLESLATSAATSAGVILPQLDVCVSGGRFCRQ